METGRHRLYERVVEGVEHHEGDDRPFRLCGVEPPGGQRHVHPPDHGAFGRRVERLDPREEQERERDECPHGGPSVAPGLQSVKAGDVSLPRRPTVSIRRQRGFTCARCGGGLWSTEELRPKLTLNRGGPNAAFVARGEAEMAIQLAHEIRAVPGIAFIPLPAEFQRMFVFSAGLASNVKELGAAKSLLQFLSGPEGMTVIRAKGMDPVARK
jgi:hypothetical protein